MDGLAPAAALPASPFVSMVGEDIKQFMGAHSLDDSARTKLESLPLDQQLDVVSQDATNVRNMSAVVISRAVRCQREGAAFAGQASQEYVGGLVTKFIEMLGLDAKAATGLRNLQPKDQVAVMAKDMEGVTNPSGVVDSRVRKLSRAAVPAALGGQMMLAAQPTHHMAAPPARYSAPPPAAAMAVSGGGAAYGAAAPMDAGQYLEQAYRAFVATYNIDERAQGQVAQLSPLEKLEVISQGMENVYNPSGAVASRCAKVHERPVILGPRAVQWVQEVAQLFCKSYGIDPSSDACKILQALPADKQFEVCSQSMSGARNPQSVLYCRIQKLGQVPPAAANKSFAPPPAFGMLNQGPRVPTPPAPPAVVPSPAPPARTGNTLADVEQLISQYGLDERAAGSLRDLAARDPQAAEDVMAQPITAEVRNPSGVIHARITKRAAAVGGLGRPSPY